MIGRVSTRGFYAGVSFILVGTMALGGCEHLPGASALTPTFLAKSVDKRPADPLLLGPGESRRAIDIASTHTAPAAATAMDVGEPPALDCNVSEALSL